LIVSEPDAAVRWLDVAVDVASVVHKHERVGYLDAEQHRRAQREALARREPPHFGQVLAEQLHHDVRARCFLATRDKARHGLACLQRFEYLLLVFEHRTLLAVAARHLDGHVRVAAVGAFVLMQV
jgi:hypothetical protein